jgi:hypothetical protein
LSQAASMFIFCSQRPLSQLQITSCCTVKVCLEEGTLSLSLSLSLSFFYCFDRNVIKFRWYFPTRVSLQLWCRCRPANATPAMLGRSAVLCRWTKHYFRVYKNEKTKSIPTVL